MIWGALGGIARAWGWLKLPGVAANSNGETPVIVSCRLRDGTSGATLNMRQIPLKT